MLDKAFIDISIDEGVYKNSEIDEEAQFKRLESLIERWPFLLSNAKIR